MGLGAGEKWPATVRSGAGLGWCKFGSTPGSPARNTLSRRGGWRQLCRSARSTRRVVLYRPPHAVRAGRPTRLPDRAVVLPPGAPNRQPVAGFPVLQAHGHAGRRRSGGDGRRGCPIARGGQRDGPAGHRDARRATLDAPASSASPGGVRRRYRPSANAPRRLQAHRDVRPLGTRWEVSRP